MDKGNDAINNVLIHKKMLASIVIYFAACLLISTLKGQSDSTSYCPMAVEGATWVFYDNTGFHYPIGYDSYVLRISGDSLHDNKHYKVAHIANLSHDILSRPEEVVPPYSIDEFKFFGLVRDDTINRQFLGIIPIYDDSVNVNEVLIHDFGLSIGDTLAGAFQFTGTTLEEVRVIEFYGKNRNTHISARPDFIAEGLGNIYLGPFCQTQDVFTQDGYRTLLDYCIGTVEECNLDFTTNVIQTEQHNSTVLIFPNPALSTQDLIIKASPNIRSDHLSCYDMNGQLQFRYPLSSLQDNHRIKIGNLSPGLYIFKYGNVSKKVVIQ